MKIEKKEMTHVLPGMVKMGASKKYSENLTASSVAEVTMSFISGRSLTACFRRPKRTSVEMVRSCASSSMMHEYVRISESISASLKNSNQSKVKQVWVCPNTSGTV